MKCFRLWGCIALITALPQSLLAGTEISGPTMGTYYKVIIDQLPEKLSPERLQELIEQQLDEVNAQMSTWDAESEISRFNAASTTEWVPVSATFAGVVESAIEIHRLSEGAFDPTVEPLIRIWGFGDNRERAIPAEEEISRARERCGMEYLSVRLDPPAIKKDLPELQLNLSAIAKGTAVDVVSELLVELGCPSFVVDIGGENRAGAAKHSGTKWRLGIESPLGGLQRIVSVSHAAIATSGDYRNYFQMAGETYSHAIDPTTGWPAKNPPASVSVLADSCELADAWATAMMILGTEKGLAIATRLGLSVLFQEVSEDGGVVTSAAGDLAERDDSEEVSAGGGTAEPSDDEQDSSSAQWFPFVAAAVIFLIAIAGMAVGTMVQNRSIKGSCGGLASMPGGDGKSVCDLCSIPKDECTNADLREKLQAAAANAADSKCDESDC